MKNLEFSVNNVLIYTYTNSLYAVKTNIISNSSGIATGLNYRKITGTQTSGWYFNNQENIYTYNGNLMLWCDYGEISTSNGKITSFTPKTVFHATDYNDLTTIAANGNIRNIGQIIQSTIPLTDAGLHLLDGALIQGGGVYDAFVQYIASLSRSYPQCFTDETTWQNTVNSKGVCGKFVYNLTNNTVRLPKITGFVEGTVDSNALGDLVEAGLPNITGNIWAGDTYGSSIFTSSSGFIQNGSNSGWRTNTVQSTVSGASDTVTFDASRSSSIYGNSNTVQPQAIKVFYYIVVANSTKTNIEVDIDEIVTDLNSKANNADVVHLAGTEIISGNKSFSGVGIFTNYNAFWKAPYNIIIRSASIENGVTPSSNQYMGIEFRDKNDVRVGWIGLAKKTDGTQQIELQKQGATSGFTTTTPSISDNSTKIATTAYINNKFQVVSTLPVNPDSNVYYFIPE